MNQIFPCRYGPIYHGTIFFYFLEKYLKKFFVLPALPSNEKNSSDNSYNKGPNLEFFSFTESPSNSLFTITFQKIISHLLITGTCPKQQWPFFGHQRALGVKLYTHGLHLFPRMIRGWNNCSATSIGLTPLRQFGTLLILYSIDQTISEDLY
jgi:hypothetical protein